MIQKAPLRCHFKYLIPNSMVHETEQKLQLFHKLGMKRKHNLK